MAAACLEKLDQDLASIREARERVVLAREAQRAFARFSQGQVDAVVRAAAVAAVEASERTAHMAHEETGYGIAEDKVIKDKFCSAFTYESIKGTKTVGVVLERPEEGLAAIAEPVGVIAALIPVTNPTSTIFFKTLIALKARNAIICAPHPRAERCGAEATRVVAEAAVAAGAPRDLVQCLERVSLPGTQELMQHRLTNLVLATGGAAMVAAAYSSGKPTLAVGPGNCPVYIDSSVEDPDEAVAMVVASKTFDNSTACASEQALVVERPVAPRVRRALIDEGAYFLSKVEIRALGPVVISPGGTPTPEGVGQSAERLARMAGFSVPAGTRMLIAELDVVGPEEPLSREILAPVLAYYEVRDRDGGFERCDQLLRFGGDGHTFVIHAGDPQVIGRFASGLRSFRILINQPALFGAMGYTSGLEPSFMLGTGTWGGSVVADNVSVRHLLQLKRVASPVKDWKLGRDEMRTVAVNGRAPGWMRAGAPPSPVPLGAAAERADSRRELGADVIEGIVQSVLDKLRIPARQ